MTTPLPTIDATLTAAERAAPFRLAAPDDEPLPPVTRYGIEIERRWNGPDWTDINPATGEILASGTITTTKGLA